MNKLIFTHLTKKHKDLFETYPGICKATTVERGEMVRKSVMLGVLIAVGAVAVQLPSFSNDLHLRGGGGGGGEDLTSRQENGLKHSVQILREITDSDETSNNNNNDDDTKSPAPTTKAPPETTTEKPNKKQSSTRPSAVTLAAVQLIAVAIFFKFKGEEKNEKDHTDAVSSDTEPQEQTLQVEVLPPLQQPSEGIRNRSSPRNYSSDPETPQDEVKAWRWKSSYKAPIVICTIIAITILMMPSSMNSGRPTVHKVFYYAWITDMATGLGVLPFLCVSRVTPLYLGRANAIAAGMMSSASAQLFLEATDTEVLQGWGFLGDPWLRCAFGMLLGFVFIIQTKKVLDRHDDVHFADLSLLDTKKVLLIIMVMTLHSFTEGVGIGVAFGGDRGASVGFCIAICLTIHNIPEGLAVALVLVPRGVNKLNTFLWCILTSLPQPLMAVPAFLFVETFMPLLPVGLGFASGAMLWVAFFELLDEAAQDTSRVQATVITTVSLAGAYLLQQFVTD
eukprot:TRINITY_DN5912_c2_g1_i1.p1 TRINITY_DN5912_c2_g1~~TRINITY_DN5912_c2_g1_i1.p1  ORF type:complete len:524 (+),score=71.02 TRINITY_DN5912_c2_g1_i1:56-1573(+)